MRPKRYPYSGKLKASTMDIVKAWEKAYSAYRAKGQELTKISNKIISQKGMNRYAKSRISVQTSFAI